MGSSVQSKELVQSDVIRSGIIGCNSRRLQTCSSLTGPLASICGISARSEMCVCRVAEEIVENVDVEKV